VRFGPEQLGFGGSDGDAEYFGDFGVRITFEDVQVENGSKTGRQLLQDANHVFCGRFFRAVGFGVVGDVAAVDVHYNKRFFLPLQVLEGRIDKYFAHPTFKIADTAVLMQVAEYFYKSFLQNILGIFARIGIAQAEGKHFALEALKKLLLRRAVALNTGGKVGFDHLFVEIVEGVEIVEIVEIVEGRFC
jgi:hypothetical protein